MMSFQGSISQPSQAVLSCLVQDLRQELGMALASINHEDAQERAAQIYRMEKM